ncbi:MAG: hypothetical protein HY318_19855 [Armatimonadetes bacterium]|nr:hypothetical protein [Armatimonadota bacterium]
MASVALEKTGKQWYPTATMPEGTKGCCARHSTGAYLPVGNNGKIVDSQETT